LSKRKAKNGAKSLKTLMAVKLSIWSRIDTIPSSTRRVKIWEEKTKKKFSIVSLNNCKPMMPKTKKKSSKHHQSKPIHFWTIEAIE
jgi:hypothetical protein